MLSPVVMSDVEAVRPIGLVLGSFSSSHAGETHSFQGLAVFNEHDTGEVAIRAWPMLVHCTAAAMAARAGDEVNRGAFGVLGDAFSVVEDGSATGTAAEVKVRGARLLADVAVADVTTGLGLSVSVGTAPYWLS